jgi:DNA-binding NtrC family response regulator
LLAGEKGVGKKVVARTIHANSPRSDGPFVVVSCRSTNAEHVEAEIFGPIAEGAEADSESPGKLANAQGGTLLLEGVDALSRPVQARILELLADRSAGGAPRVLASTSEDLPALVAEGRFDEDLCDLLQVVTIELPPLRSREEDIPDLVQFFISRCNAEFDMTIRGVDPRVEEQLRGHSWPGNVRQLQNVIKSACLLARGDVITLDDIGDGLTDRGSAGSEEVKVVFERAVRDALELRLNAEGNGGRRAPFHDVVAQVEEALIREALARTGGNQLKAAGLLELNRTTLRTKIQLYGI